MRRPSLLVLALAFAAFSCAIACKRPHTDATIMKDPAPHEPKTPPKPEPPGDASLILLHARVIDPVTATVLHTLEPSPPLPKHETSRRDRGYLQTATALEAFDLRAGKKLWSQPATCTAIEATQRGVSCASTRVLDLYDADTGAHRSLATSSAADVTQLLAVKDHVLVLRADGTLESIEDPSGALVATTKVPFPPLRYEPFAPNERGACIASAASHDVDLACFDPSATLLFHKTYVLSKPTDPSFTSFTVRQIDANFLVASTWFGTAVRRGVAVRLSDGVALVRVEEELTFAVARDDGALEGVIVTEPATRFLDASGALRWTNKTKLSDATSALLLDRTLVVASFHPIAAGATLQAFDVGSGAVRWTGDVDLLPIAHSIYSNHVDLTLRGGRIAMRGREAAQDYLEIFEPSDGKRVLSELVGLW
jgi:hypothetical protein